MKAMFTQCCCDIVTPQGDLKPRWCQCGRHACWWRNGSMGWFSIFDMMKKSEGENWKPCAFVLGFNNMWLLHPNENLTKEDYKKVVEQTPSSYLFKTLETVCIRIRPGQSNDTMFEDKLP